MYYDYIINVQFSKTNMLVARSALVYDRREDSQYALIARQPLNPIVVFYSADQILLHSTPAPTIFVHDGSSEIFSWFIFTYIENIPTLLYANIVCSLKRR